MDATPEFAVPEPHIGAPASQAFLHDTRFALVGV